MATLWSMATLPLVALFLLAMEGATLTLSPVASQRKPVASQRTPATFAVVARVFWGEVPYLKSFLAHYDRLGVQRAVLIVTDSSDVDVVEPYVKTYGFGGTLSNFQAVNNRFSSLDNKLLVDLRVAPKTLNATLYRRQAVSDPIHSTYDLGSPSWSHVALRELNIKEDYIIAVDVDEYLVPPRGDRTLADTVAKSPDIDLFISDWILVPFDNDRSSHTTFKGYSAQFGKYIIKKDRLLQLGDEASPDGPHMPADTTCGKFGDKCKQQDLGPTLVHFHYRSIWDALIKEAGIFKNYGIQDTLSQVDATEPSLRMKSLAFSTVGSMKTGIPIANFNISWVPTLTVDTEAEMVMLRNRASDAYDARARYEDLYWSLKNVLSFDDVWNSVPSSFKSPAGIVGIDGLSGVNLTYLKSLHHGLSLSP